MYGEYDVAEVGWAGFSHEKKPFGRVCDRVMEKKTKIVSVCGEKSLIVQRNPL